jgi:L-seryl-tRNA(Ser) seleniumtransferase
LVTVEDLGSGLQQPLDGDGLVGEPTVKETLASGVDLVCFSGDKLLGGPQGGIILGRRRLISRLRANPLSRALRVDKLTLAALEAVLRLYLFADHPEQILPHMNMIHMPLSTVRSRARGLVRHLQTAMPGILEVELLDGYSAIGGGSCPGANIPTCLVGLRARGIGASQLARLLRSGEPAVLGRVAGDRLALDLRTVATRELPGLREALAQLCRSIERSPTKEKRDRA